MNKFKFSVTLICGIVFGATIAILSIVILFLGYTNDSNNILEVVRVLFSGGIFLSVIIAIAQMRQNAKKIKKDEEWNQKYLAYTQMNKFVTQLEKIRTSIDKIVIKEKLIESDNGVYISFTDRKRQNDPLSVEEIHRWICVDKSGTRVNVAKESSMCAMTEHGTIINRNLIAIINTYESIAIGIKQGVLNRCMIEDGLSELIVNNYEFMEKYIKHRREKHENIGFATEWEELYLDIKKGGKC